MLWPINYTLIQFGVRMCHVLTDFNTNRNHSPPLPFYLFERCAQAITNKETWTEYLSLGFFSIVVCHVCYQFHLFMFAICFYVFYLCMYISLYRSYIFSLVNILILPSVIWKLNIMNTCTLFYILFLLALLIFVCFIL